MPDYRQDYAFRMGLEYYILELYEESELWFLKSERNGIKEATYYLHKIYNITNNHEKLSIYSEKVKKLKNIKEVPLFKNFTPDRLYNQALRYETENKLDKAIEYYEKSAEHKFTKSMLALSRIYKSLNNIDKMIYWLTKASEYNDTTAMYDLGLFYFKKGDIINAKKYWTMGSDLNDNKCIKSLANLYDEELNYIKAIEYYLLIAENDPSVKLDIAFIYDKLNNLTETETWLLSAVKSNVLGSRYYLGLYYDRLSLEDKAEYWYKEASKKDNDKDAMFNLGCLYRNKREIDKAIEYWEKAADLGHKFAKHNLDYFTRKPVPIKSNIIYCSGLFKIKKKINNNNQDKVIYMNDL